MARANTIMGCAMLLVVVMALYVGKAQGATGVCIYDCAREHAAEHGGSWGYYLPECGGLCLQGSFTVRGVTEGKPSPKMQKAVELLAEAPDVNLPSLGRKF
ncbi:hypothetical protein MKW94_014412 [Papaver nudicaule]|uniref:Uncharacterized protein n=1 Tax=Papaver nudicaule TaxID=74823 RepID=A0AA41SBA5_PAPNU|nr:hypothetical protein [Papaver nudicaule]